MNKSLELIKRELKFVERRIALVRGGNVKEDKGLSLKDALAYKEDYKKTIELIEKNL